MRRKSWWMSIFVCGCVASAHAEPSDTPEDTPAESPTTAPASIYVEVLRLVPDSGRPEKIVGNLISHDEFNVQIQTKDGTVQLAWEDLTPQSAYTVKSRLIDKSNAGDWLELGRWGWNHRLKKQATIALNKARQLDRELADDVEAIFRSEPTGAIDGASADSKQQSGQEKITQYQPATPEEIEESRQRAEALKKSAEEFAGIELVTLETAHFIIYTDWEKTEFEWMKQQCEMAYRVVARQFRMSASDNVFVGKLPIVMFDKRSNFEMFASQHDNVPVGVVAGYYSGRDDGSGHMVMWRPNRRVTGEAGRKDAENKWARILVHEFTHAYIARYKSNGFIPRWLNEGMADYIAQGVLPEGGYFAYAREFAHRGIDVSDVFNDNIMPGGEYYPVMMSMVKMLSESKPKAFMEMFDDIKNGMEGEDALKKHFKIDYDELHEHWTKYAKTLK